MTISSHRFGHVPALFCATFARIGATLAVIHVMFAAFFSASAAYLRAQSAEFLGKLRVTRHQLSREQANVRAIPVEPNAAFHHLDIVLLQAGGRAMFAFLSALETRFNTISILIVSHVLSLLGRKVASCARVSTAFFDPKAFSGESPTELRIHT